MVVGVVAVGVVVVVVVVGVAAVGVVVEVEVVVVAAVVKDCGSTLARFMLDHEI
jgi:hypothetical protein